jgi:hypothetical protein
MYFVIRNTGFDKLDKYRKIFLSMLLADQVVKKDHRSETVKIADITRDETRRNPLGKRLAEEPTDQFVTLRSPRRDSLKWASCRSLTIDS